MTDPANPDPLLQRLLKLRRMRSWRLLGGLALMLAGYASLAIPPDTPSHWLVPRLALGFGLLFGGAP